MARAIYPGSFDPVTRGHLDIIGRAARVMDEVIIGVLANSAKTPLFTVEERVEMLRECTAQWPNVQVETFDGLTVEFARKMKADVMVRGLRAVTDFENEFMMAMINHKLNPDLDTMFLMAEQKYLYLSSSTVKEMGRYDADLTEFLPAEIIADFTERIHQRRKQHG